jgi:hypothetical protein
MASEARIPTAAVSRGAPDLITKTGVDYAQLTAIGTVVVLPAAVVGAIEGCTGAKCEGNDGKPDSIMFGTIMTVIGLEREQCVMSGDRLYTDIRTAKGAGMPSAIVLTGESTAEDIRNASEENLPDPTWSGSTNSFRLTCGMSSVGRMGKASRHPTPRYMDVRKEESNGKGSVPLGHRLRNGGSEGRNLRP